MEVILMVVLVVLIGGLIVVRYKQKQEEAAKVQQTETSKSILSEAKQSDSEIALQEEIRPLNTMDAAMIKARIEKLEIVAHLEPNKQERLFRKVLDMCKKGTEGLWWEPLEWFAKNLRTKDDQTIVVLNSKRVDLRTIANINDSLSVITRLGELQFVRIDPPGEDFEYNEQDLLVDGTYKMVYQRRDKVGHFPVVIKDEKFDVISWMREINNILRKLRIPFRFLVFAPKGNVWCFVYTPVVCAERAIKSKWGVV